MYKKSKYTIEQEQAWSVTTIEILSKAPEALSCEQICRSDIELSSVTPQKMARILTKLSDAGFVIKSKGKDGRMRYKSTAVLIEQGYELDKMVY